MVASQKESLGSISEFGPDRTWVIHVDLERISTNLRGNGKDFPMVRTRLYR